MEKETVEINGKKFIVRELLATESDEILDMDLKKVSDRIKTRLIKQCDLDEDTYKQLTEKERDKLLNTMNKLNGWTEDFQNTQVIEKTN